jgi:hypothetical protein
MKMTGMTSLLWFMASYVMELPLSFFLLMVVPHHLLSLVASSDRPLLPYQVKDSRLWITWHHRLNSLAAYGLSVKLSSTFSSCLTRPESPHVWSDLV